MRTGEGPGLVAPPNDRLHLGTAVGTPGSNSLWSSVSDEGKWRVFAGTAVWARAHIDFAPAEVSRETPGSPQPTYRYRVLRSQKRGDMSQSSARLSHPFGNTGVGLPRRRFSYAHTGSKVASLPEGEALAG